MSDEIAFYYNPMSRGRIVHWMLEEVGAPYRVELLSFEKAEHKRPEYLAINPMGKVPAIVHRGTVVTETPAICAYLADAFPRAQLAPALDDPARGTYLRWLFFAASCIEQALVDRMFSRPPPDRPGVLGYGNYDDMANALERALIPGPNILGERFSAADVYVSSQIGWGMAMKGFDARPTYHRYVARCMERPAYQRFLAQNEQLAAQLKARNG
jgi:glutathione S-transferase